MTLGVRDLDVSTRFYEEIGFTKSEKSSSSITWLRTGSTVLTLYTWTSLAQDAGLPESSSGFRGITLALNMQSRDLVDEFIETVRRSGGKIIKEPMQVFWGGYSSYFSDPDGHLWRWLGTLTPMCARSG